MLELGTPIERERGDRPHIIPGDIFDWSFSEDRLCESLRGARRPKICETRTDRKHHSRLHHSPIIIRKVEYVRGSVEVSANAMAREVRHHLEAVAVGQTPRKVRIGIIRRGILDRGSDLIEGDTGTAYVDGGF